jgi:uncharacterized membrane protein
MEEKKQTPSHLKASFFTGLAILLPVTVTIAVLGWIIHFLTKPFVGIVSSILKHLHIINRGFLFLTPDQTLIYGSQLLILIFLFFFTVALGMVARWFLFKSFLSFSDRILHRIPLVRTVYKTVQEIVKTLFASEKKSFQQVVMVAFPHPDAYVLGFVAQDAPEACSVQTQEDLVSVFIPTTPNPTTGYTILYKKKDLIFPEMKAEDAIKYIISCGLIYPPEAKSLT